MKLRTSTSQRREGRHKLFGGKTGSGKTNLFMLMAMEAILEATQWVTLVFPHPESGVRFIAELRARLGERFYDRVIVENMGQLQHVIMRTYLQKSDNCNEWEAERENEEACRALLEGLGETRPDLKSIEERGSIVENSLKLARACQHLDVWMPESEMLKALRPGSKEYHFVLNHCTHPEHRENFRSIEQIPERERFNQLYATQRTWEARYGNVATKARCSRPPVWNKKEHLKKNGVHIILGGATNRHGLSTHVQNDFYENMQWALKEEIGPGVYGTDESTNYHFITSLTARAYATLRAVGFSIFSCIQTLDFPTEEIARTVVQNSDIYSFCLTDPTAADAWKIPTTIQQEVNELIQRMLATGVAREPGSDESNTPTLQEPSNRAAPEPLPLFDPAPHSSESVEPRIQPSLPESSSRGNRGDAKSTRARK